MSLHLLWLSDENTRKLLLTLAVFATVLLVRYGLGKTLDLFKKGKETSSRFAFWSRQILRILTSLLVIYLFVSIWFPNPERLAPGLGLFSAGVAFALQKVITAVAGYIVILRGKFRVGDRISMGGVRGEVISLSFVHTQIMEMGSPVSSGSQSDSNWVQARQFTGRIVTVTNDKVFEEPVYNYTKDFPFIWEEIKIPIPFQANWERADEILLAAANHYTHEIFEMSEDEKQKLRQKFNFDLDQVRPKTFCRITDNWIELTLRFVVRDRGIRYVKDSINREILREFEKEKMSVASSTFAITEVPPLVIQKEQT